MPVFSKRPRARDDLIEAVVSSGRSRLAGAGERAALQRRESHAGSAANRQGVALARNVLVEADLASGRLARLFNVCLPSSRAYYALRSPSAKARPEVRTFVEW